MDATQIHLAVSTPKATGRDWRPRALQGRGMGLVSGEHSLRGTGHMESHGVTYSPGKVLMRKDIP